METEIPKKENRQLIHSDVFFHLFPFFRYFNLEHLCKISETSWISKFFLWKSLWYGSSLVDDAAHFSCHCSKKMRTNHDFQARKFYICFDSLQWILYQNQFLVRILWPSPCKMWNRQTFWYESLPFVYGIALCYWPKLLSNKWSIL